MEKEKFLELAGQLFDQSNVEVENKIVLDKNIWDEIVDQVGSEINDLGKDLIENYELEMYSNEVTLESVSFDYEEIERTIGRVLEKYFQVR